MMRGIFIFKSYFLSYFKQETTEGVNNVSIFMGLIEYKLFLHSRYLYFVCRDIS